MNVVGLITEYNPFHNGHLYHIEQAKKQTNADYVVVVMSGNYVQRGVPAVTDKYTRTKMALSCGADLVIELPVVYATASAETFALGAIQCLNALGFVDSICFGSECGNIALLTEIASSLCNETKELKELLAKYVKSGMTYPVARTEALLQTLLHDHPNYSKDELTTVLTSPNNILGIEYIKALIRTKSKLIPYTIERTVSGYHDETIHATISSASAIRLALTESLESIQGSMPPSAYEQFKNAYQKTMPITADDFSALLYYKLLYSEEEELETYLDVSTDLAKRILKERIHFRSFSQFTNHIKTKNITHTRASRSLLHILLTITDDSLCFDHAPYLRILGFKKEASFLIRKSNNEFACPIITKVGDYKSLLNEQQRAIMELDLRATHLYNQIVYDKFGYELKSEFHRGLIIQ